MSHKRPLQVLLLLYIGGIIVVSLTPGDLITVNSAQHVDKVGHFIAYTGLGLLLGLTVSGRNGRLLAALGAIGLGFLLEWGQSFVPGRAMSLADGLVNTGGVIFGLLLIKKGGHVLN